MPAISYPVLKCILEHIEANCRFSISARCPEISRVEKNIPLLVERLDFIMRNRVGINDNSFYVSSKETERWYSDRMSDQPCTLQLCNFKSKFSAERNISTKYGAEAATRRIVEYLLGGRNKIRVKLFIVFNCGYQTMQYLFGICNVKVSALKCSSIGLIKLNVLIENPLKELHFVVNHPTDFENPIARTAEKIVITNYGYDGPNFWLSAHRNLPNKEVIIDTYEHGFTDIKILKLIEYWKENHKAVGSSFSVCKGNGDSIEMFLENVKERFQGNYVKLKKTDTKTFFNVKAVSIKIDSESKIVVYGGRPYRLFPMSMKVVIKVMDIESSEELSEPSEKSDFSIMLSSYSPLVVLNLFGLLIALFFCLIH
ncbi:hypothetical protein B9Z55_007001 [Caenorhabditis nigoni]|uniref:F-box associated domain-containing protein n=1 Tax=Caenorhabditis nigoni TaxID=1611254 RepID=A0A2G5V7Q6_9PELO|nr:hypothetical protein B9Z55_007001 [Caenorhabditis nigoni]